MIEHDTHTWTAQLTDGSPVCSRCNCADNEDLPNPCPNPAKSCDYEEWTKDADDKIRTLFSQTAQPDVWARILADERLARAREKLSIHELRLIIDHAEGVGR